MELWIVTSAASLLEGDELRIELSIGAGDTLVVRTVAAQLVYPSVHGATASVSVQVEAAAGSTLWWWPEPTIVAGGARFRAEATVALGAGARCHWRDELVLGRTGEEVDTIDVATALRVDLAGVPLVRDGLRSAPGWRGPATMGAARYLAAYHELGDDVGSEGALPEDTAGVERPTPWMRLAGPGRTARVVDRDTVAGQARLRALLGTRAAIPC